MSLIESITRLKTFATAVEFTRFGVGCVGLAAMISLVPIHASASLNSRIGNSLSFGSYQAPVHKRARGYSVGGERSASQEIANERNEDEQYALNIPGADYYYLPSEDMSASEEEELEGWRGYLKEKGPSRVIVEVEVEQELKPLSDQVWDLIMGNEPEIDSSRNSPHRTVRMERNVVTIPKKQVEENRHVVEAKPVQETHNIHKEEGEEESAITEDAAESYKQLMDLFNRPVFATPTEEFGDADGMVSFRLPQNGANVNPAVRTGSKARFEIRRQ